MVAARQPFTNQLFHKCLGCGRGAMVCLWGQRHKAKVYGHRPYASPHLTQKTLQLKLTVALRDNLILKRWEFAHGVTVLRSYPWRLSVPSSCAV
jgi:hypothetical protein